jgi:hypothetical protein
MYFYRLDANGFTEKENDLIDNIFNTNFTFRDSVPYRISIYSAIYYSEGFGVEKYFSLFCWVLFYSAAEISILNGLANGLTEVVQHLPAVMFLRERRAGVSTDNGTMGRQFGIGDYNIYAFWVNVQISSGGTAGAPLITVQAGRRNSRLINQ